VTIRRSGAADPNMRMRARRGHLLGCPGRARIVSELLLLRSEKSSNQKTNCARNRMMRGEVLAPNKRTEYARRHGDQVGNCAEQSGALSDIVKGLVEVRMVEAGGCCTDSEGIKMRGSVFRSNCPKPPFETSSRAWL
jgi:hypothetical protein